MIYFVIGWVLLGLIAHGCYMFLMKLKYTNYLKEDEDWDLFPLQIFMAVIAGPLTFIALSVIFDDGGEE